MRKLPLYPDIIESLVHVVIDDIEKDEKLIRLLHNAYRIEKGETACCFDKVLVPFHRQLTSYYKSINPTYQKPIKMGKENQEFELKPKMKLMTPIDGAMQMVTTDNVTDKTAVATIAHSAGRANCFTRKPSDWKERVAKYKKSIGVAEDEKVPAIPSKEVEPSEDEMNDDTNIDPVDESSKEGKKSSSKNKK